MADFNLGLVAPSGGGSIFGGFPDAIGDLLGGLGDLLSGPAINVGGNTLANQLLRLVQGGEELPQGGQGAGEEVMTALGVGGDECSLYRQPTGTPVWRAKPLVFQRSPKDGSLHFWRHVGVPREFSRDASLAKQYLRRHGSTRGFRRSRTTGRKRRR